MVGNEGEQRFSGQEKAANNDASKGSSFSRSPPQLTAIHSGHMPENFNCARHQNANKTAVKERQEDQVIQTLVYQPYEYKFGDEAQSKRCKDTE